MALLAAAHQERRDAEERLVPLDDLRERVVEGTQDLRRLGVAAGLELRGLALVAAGAVGGGYDGVDDGAVVLEGAPCARI